MSADDRKRALKKQLLLASALLSSAQHLPWRKPEMKEKQC